VVWGLSAGAMTEGPELARFSWILTSPAKAVCSQCSHPCSCRVGCPDTSCYFRKLWFHYLLGRVISFVSEKGKVLWKGFSPLSSFNLEILIKQADHGWW